MHRSPLLALALATGLAMPVGAALAGARQDEPARVAALPQDVSARLLAAHNVERARVGTAALRWDDALAAEAGVWARELVNTGRWEHDPARHGHGENLWTGWGNRIWTPEEMVGDWTAEKRHYVRGVFPDVSRTGDWTAVGHYTQMIWSETTHVGCAIAARGNRSVLACRYSPPGNIRGSRVF